MPSSLCPFLIKILIRRKYVQVAPTCILDVLLLPSIPLENSQAIPETPVESDFHSLTI